MKVPALKERNAGALQDQTLCNATTMHPRRWLRGTTAGRFTHFHKMKGFRTEENILPFTFFYLFAVLNTYLNHLIIFVLLLLTHLNYQFTPLGHLSVRLPKNISSHNKIPSLFLSHSLSSYLRSHYGSPSPLPHPPPSLNQNNQKGIYISVHHLQD